jgi:hypothetical protein
MKENKKKEEVSITQEQLDHILREIIEKNKAAFEYLANR